MTACRDSSGNPQARRKSRRGARIERPGSYGWAGSFRAAGAAAIGAGLLWTASPALAEKGGPCHSIKQQVSEIKVTLYKSRTLCFSGPFSTAVIGAPEIADVLPITESMLYVQGKKVGATNISVFDQQRRLVSVIDLEVAPDTSSLQNKIAASTGGRDINVTSANGEVILSGEATDAVAAARAVQVAKGLSQDAPVIDAMKVAPSQQVMLKVRILEVDRNAGRDLGINWFGKTHSVSFATGLGGLRRRRQTTAGSFPVRARQSPPSAFCWPMSSIPMASASTCSFPRSRKKVSSGAWPNPISSRCRERRRPSSPAAKFPFRSSRARMRPTARLGSGSTTRRTSRSNGSNTAWVSTSLPPCSTTA